MRYWKTWFETDWSAGSTMIWAQEGADEGTRITDPEQVVLEYDPPRRLAYTWHTFTPEWAQASGISEDVRARLAGERRSKVAFDLVPAGEMVKLTVVHDGFDDGSLVAEMVSGGWPRVVAELKTMLETGHAAADGYDVVTSIAAPRERVFAALTTLDGLAGWWVPTVTGSPESGGDLTFSFGDQRMLMHVDRADAPVSVVWTCRAHSRFPEWSDTRLVFELEELPDGSTRLRFRHVGLVPDLGECFDLCSAGWDHYFRSLTAFVETGTGNPWGSEEWAATRPNRPATASR